MQSLAAHLDTIYYFGASSSHYVLSPLQRDLLPNDTRIKHCHLGKKHAIITDINDTIWVIGNNNNGQLGLSQNNEIQGVCQHTYFADKHIQISNIFTSPLSHCTFWLDNNGNLYANGDNELGKLGLPKTIRKTQGEIRRISQLQHVKQVAVGNYHNLVICGTGLTLSIVTDIISHWLRGHNKTCTTNEKHIPSEIVLIMHTYCGENEVYSAGHEADGNQSGDHGQYGYGVDRDSAMSEQWNPIETFRVSKINIIKVAAGGYHSIFLDTEGIVYGCGGTRWGQLGIGHTNTDKNRPPTMLPKFVQQKIKVVDICSGFSHCLFIDVSGNLYAWGANNLAQCGLGHMESAVIEPMNVDSLKGRRVIRICCGNNHSYCLSEDEQHYLWGSNGTNQCTLEQTESSNSMTKVTWPICVNKVFMKLTKKKINQVILGHDSTVVLSE